MAEYTSRIAYCVSRFDGSERDDLRNVFATIGVGRIVNHLFAIPGVKVHIDIGH